jgi:hypothetical protein
LPFDCDQDDKILNRAQIYDCEIGVVKSFDVYFTFCHKDAKSQSLFHHINLYNYPLLEPILTISATNYTNWHEFFFLIIKKLV